MSITREDATLGVYTECLITFFHRNEVRRQKAAYSAAST